jgi:hypothetical protein
MLTKFLEHTRCPEASIASLVAQCRAVSELESEAAGLHGKGGPITKTYSPLGPVELLATLQRPASSGNPSICRLSEFDNAIRALQLEEYVDRSISSFGQRRSNSMVRQFYYLLRPLFPVNFRKYLQRIALRGWDSIPFPSWPVDFTTEKLMEAVWQLLLNSQGQQELPFIWFWPEGQSSCCIMTHDVETHIGRDFCKTMMEVEKRYSITSAFEVVPEERYAVSDKFLQQIRDSGCEVCIHGLNHDGHLFSSETLFRERAEKINAYARSWGALGFRSPVMYRNPKWLHALQFSYDMSVPNVAHLDPQRGGCCTVMPYFNGDILELPLTTTQDYSLFNVLQQRSLELWIKQIAMIQERHGLISFIIHPDYVNEQWSTNLYETLLAYLAELRSDHGVWIALPKEVDSWWRARRQMRLIQQNGTWRISGPKAERARLAYASVKNGQLVYRIEQADIPVGDV